MMLPSSRPTRKPIELRPESRVLVTGHRGLAGSAIVRRLVADGHAEPLTASRSEVDLRERDRVVNWFSEVRPEVVIHAAGRVGGIAANTSDPVPFLVDNATMVVNVLAAAHSVGAGRLLFLGSSCIYPRDIERPISESDLLSGPLEPTNLPYAIAKIVGVVGCDAYRAQYGRDFLAVMPTNLYGPGDRFDDAGHVAAALMKRFHDAKCRGERRLTVWGSGRPRRELLHVDDFAEACLLVLRRYRGSGPVNIGTGKDVSIRELAETLREIVHPEGELTFDKSRPDGAPRKRLDVSILDKLGWRPRRDLCTGLTQTYDWFCRQEGLS